MHIKAKLLGRTSVLAILCTGGVLAVGAPAASAATVKCATPITGSGSSLQSLAQQEVFSKKFGETPGGWEHENSEEGTGSTPFQHCEKPVTVTYTATSSGEGEKEWGEEAGVLTPTKAGGAAGTAGELDEYIGTDVGPEGTATTGQMGNMDKAGGKSASEPNSILTVPIAQSAIAMVVSLPKKCLLGKPAEKATILNSQLQKAWSEPVASKPKFTALLGKAIEVKKEAACEVVPKLEAREKASGTSAGFKRYMNDLAPANAEWKALTATAAEAESTNWPKTLTAGEPEKTSPTGGALAKKVFETPGTIGYADLADARANGFTGVVPLKHGTAGEEYYSFIARVPNGGEAATEGKELEAKSEGTPKFENPEIETGTHAGAPNCEKASYPEPAEVNVNVDWSKARQQNNVEGAPGYPICTLTFSVAWHRYHFPKWTNAKSEAKEYSEEDKNSVFNYLSWVVNKTGGQEALEKVPTDHYGPLPSVVREKAEKGVTTKTIEF
jgi:hypothetical protein